MHTHIFRTIEAWLASVIALAVLALAAVPAQAAPFDGRRDQFADASFQKVWARTDAPQVRGGRSWYWGPGPWWDYAEFYRESPNSLRTVQYFDKARMEINDPFNRAYENGVTNGLLVVELVGGQLKKGNQPWDNDQRDPAQVPVAGDPPASNPDAPTYASFASVATINNAYRDPNRLGQTVGAAIDKGGNISERGDLARPETRIVQYNTVIGHNIPSVFWNFMHLNGVYLDNTAVRQGPVVDWLFAMGLPITDPYWVRARVGGAEKDVLVQLFERRALTYTPGNPPGYEVEMGNVGQHYFQWRYPHLGQPWAATDPNPPLLFASDAPTPEVLQIYRLVGPNTYQQLTSETVESLAFSWRRSYDPSQLRIVFDSRRGDGQHRQIYMLDAPAIYAPESGRQPVVTRLTYSDSTPPPQGPWPGPLPNGPANDYNPSVSPDGTKIAFVSDRDGTPQLYLMTAAGYGSVRLTNDNCINQTPSWSPDGRILYWERQCPEQKFAIMSSPLGYYEDSRYSVQATLNSISALTDQGSDNRYPRVSPDGRRIVFTSYRDGNSEIYLMDNAGNGQTRLTNSPAEDEAATWRADGQQLAFDSNRDGKFRVYTMSLDGSGQTLVSNTGGNDRWPAWAQ